MKSHPLSLAVGIGLCLLVNCTSNKAIAGLLQIRTEPTQRLRIPEANVWDNLGYSLDADAGTVVAGATNVDDSVHAAGAVYVFENGDNNQLQLSQTLFAPIEFQVVNQAFGQSVSLQGDTLAVGSFERRSYDDPVENIAYIYERNISGNWEFSTRLAPLPSGTEIQTTLGHPVAGTDLVVLPASVRNPGFQNYTGEIHLYSNADSSTWAPFQVIDSNDLPEHDILGLRAAQSKDHLFLTAGRESQSDEYFGLITERVIYDVAVFEKANGSFRYTGTLPKFENETGQDFGYSMAVEGDRALIAGLSEDSSQFVGVYERDSIGQWQRVATLESPFDGDYSFFGDDLSLEGDLAIISATSHKDIDADATFHVLVYQRLDDGTWTSLADLTEPEREDTAYDGRFGWSVAASVESVYVGTGVNAPGSIYSFSITPEPSTGAMLFLIMLLGTSSRNSVVTYFTEVRPSASKKGHS